MEQKAKKTRKRKKITGKMQASLCVVFCLFLVAMCLIMIRVAVIGGKKKYAKASMSQKTGGEVMLPYRRGSILDRNHNVLAESKLTYHLILDSRMLTDHSDYLDPTCRALSAVYGYSDAEIKQIIADRPESAYYRLKKNMPYEQMIAFKTYVEGLKETKEKPADKDDGLVHGVTFEEEYQRAYPFGTLASHIIGYQRTDGIGSYGVEQQYNEELTGRNGRIYNYYDAELMSQQKVLEAEDGNSLILTIDSYLQKIVQEKTENFLNTVGAKNVGVLMMDVNSAEVLAMQSNYSYDCNKPRDLSRYYTEEELAALSEEETVNALYRQWRNFCISDSYEPGSTFKPFTVAAALEENVITREDEFLCDGGEQVADYYISCHNTWGHGLINPAQSIMYSCNDVLMEIAKRAGSGVFSKYQDHFLFGRLTGIDLPGEVEGILSPVENIHETELATSSFGMSFNTTMVQLGAAFCSMVNGGAYYEPHVVKEIVSPDGVILEKMEKRVIGRTVSEATSEFLRDAFYLTVQEGTAKAAQIPGYLVGGKTGTAQKLPRSEGKYLVSFVGCVPADNPQVMIYVVIDEAADEKLQSQASIASKLAAEILTEALPHLRLYPDGEIPYKAFVIDEADVKMQEGEIGDTGVVYDPAMNETNMQAIPSEVN